MANKRNRKKIVKYKKNFSFNIGTVLFGIVFIYMIVCIFLYLTSSHTAPYEVTKGTLSGNYKYTALALKSEAVVTAPESGSVTYYAREGTEVGVNGVVCSIVETGSVNTSDTSEASAADTSESDAEQGLLSMEDSQTSKTLTSSDAKKLCATAAGYASNFSGQNFQKAYEMKADIESSLMDLYVEDVYGDAYSGSLFNLCRTSQSGIVVYAVDGYEEITPEEVTSDMFDEKDYKKENLRLKKRTASGDPIYKLITEETWSLMIPIDHKLASELTDQSSVTIRFLKDSTTARASVSVVQNGTSYFAKLELNNSVIRFSSDRFIDIELILNKKSGLKIPKSAIEEKTFYVIPEEYVISNEDNAHEITLLMEYYRNSGKSEQKYITATVYEKVDDKYYVDIHQFSEGDYVIKKDSTNKYRIEETASLQGVYNINKGYAVFREVTVIAENEEYCIVEDDSTFGLSQYDHIALDADTVSDDQIL